ncbi:hypothetical protein JL721_6784 [Aureococcus anophagefferens]|nr:hypothetical protein JL721_6784 [Aureococcus anophagefferens]
MLRSGKLLYKKHVKRCKREENARRRMKKSGLSPRDATAHEIKTLVAFMDDAVDSKDVSEAAKKSLGRGKKQQMEKFFSLAHRLYAGRLWKKIETDVLKRRARDARKGAKIVDDSKLNYSAFTAMRKELGEHGTKEKRVTGQTVIPSASSVQRVNADLDAYVAQKGLMCAGEGEMWHADYGKIMPSTFEIYGYQGVQRRDGGVRRDGGGAGGDEGMYQAEPNEEGDACTVLAAGKLKTKRDEVGRTWAPWSRRCSRKRKRRKDSSMPICCCFTLDKVGQYEFGPFRCATYSEDREKALAERVGTMPDESGLLAAEIGSRLDRATAAIQTGLDSASFAHRKAEGSDAAAWKAGTTKLRVFSMPAKRAKEIVRTSLICNSNHQIITVKHANSAGGETTRIVDVGDGTPTIKVSLLERVAEELLPDDARLPKVKLFLQELIFVLHIVNTKSWETDPSMPATFQGHADAMGRLMVEIWGPESMTPYFHDIVAGHLGQVDGN